ncbi:MAG: TIGR00159 family protein [Myxococcales bacterium]|nr:TIGR00159 family protein [Myxococcales bacterium]
MSALPELLGLPSYAALALLVLDLAIVCFALHRVLLLVRGTRAAQIAAGLALVGIVLLIGRALELKLLSRVLDHFMTHAVVLVIVVFQPEVRRGLMRLGQRLIATGRGSEETHLFEEIVGAVEHLSRARVGALLVLEREGDLSEIVEGGETLDARISKELLVALFSPSPHNALHDGAVVVKHLRVLRAGALLPLSGNPDLDRRLGTRHRAALGVTEESDAVAVVVSEERGEISLCLQGHIARDLDVAALRRALMGLFTTQERHSRRVEEEAAAAAATAHAVSALVEAAVSGPHAVVAAKTRKSAERSDGTKAVGD